MLCALALITAGCRVYDAALVEDFRLVHHVTPDASADAPARNNSVQTGSEGFDKLPACGNGRVDDAERCDIAIPSGEPGACPEACDAPDGCVEQHLAGQRCAARCEEAEIREAADGDGCCPDGASPETDSDCSGTCGNGTVEHGETCDPPSKCPQSEACVSNNPCMVARYTGSASLCSASCETHTIDSCTNDDGCCPGGCSASQDSDCAPGVRDAGTTGGGSSGDPTTCLAAHSGGSCEACDCAYCSDNVTACITGKNTDGAACKAVIDCASKNHCKALDCLCGQSSLNQCELYPRGPCRDEIFKLAGTLGPYTTVLAATNSDTGIGRAVSVLSCRNDHCGGVCGL